MKGNEKNILIGSFVVAILIVAAAWKFIYSADMEKMDQVQNEINALKVRQDELNAKNANRAMYEAGITDSQDIIDTVLSIYGPGNTPEKTIMLVVDLCKKTGCSVSDISFDENRLLFASESTSDGETPDIQVYKSGAQVKLLCGYTQSKKVMDYINSYAERMNIESFTADFDPETGQLSIPLKVNLYSVIDKNHKYVDPVIEDIELGSVNIFKTFEVVEEETTEDQNANETVNNTETGSDNGETQE